MATIIGPTLPEPQFSRVQSIRSELLEQFGIEPYPNPFPHFTLYALDDEAPTERVVSALETATVDHDPVAVHTDGIGVFPGNVVWLPVAKSPALTALQTDVVRAVEDLGTPPVPYYRPHRWFPHVGFALGVEDEQAGAIVEFLLEYDLEWDFTVENVTVTRVSQDGGSDERVATVEL